MLWRTRKIVAILSGSELTNNSRRFMSQSLGAIEQYSPLAQWMQGHVTRQDCGFCGGWREDGVSS